MDVRRFNRKCRKNPNEDYSRDRHGERLNDAARKRRGEKRNKGNGATNHTKIKQRGGLERIAEHRDVGRGMERSGYAFSRPGQERAAEPAEGQNKEQLDDELNPARNRQRQKRVDRVELSLFGDRRR